MSGPPFELIIGGIIALFLGPVVLGYICSKWGRLGLLLLLLPPVILIAIWPGLIHPGALPLFIMYGALASVGFISGFIWSKRRKSRNANIEQDESNTTMPS
jgi:hypothetical protein